MPKKLILITAVLFYTTIVFSQKLPHKQEISVWAPADIKIDGKATEWRGQFKAYNPATGMYYTMANDDQNLYLTAYITDPTSIFFKAMTGGITLIVKSPYQESSIRYPAFPKNEIPSLARISRDEKLSGSDDDPIILKDNAVFTDKAKEIEVRGMKNIDTLISLYNGIGIKVSGQFDAKQGYLYELCIPLKHLGLTLQAGTFKYQIMMNGGNTKFVFNTSNLPSVTRGTRPDGSSMSQSELDGMNMAATASINGRYATTDFSGEYTLAKKP